MADIIKQHLIDPELCIRCYTCEETCGEGAISHNDDNVVVDAEICAQCMDCISPCPTGSIDNWRVVKTVYSIEEQLGWMELPQQEELAAGTDNSTIEALDEEITTLLREAHQGAHNAIAPASASKPTVNLHNIANPINATVQGNFRLTGKDADSDVRHIIINFDELKFPFLEGQSIGIIPPGKDAKGNSISPRLYSISSPRDGERPNVNNLSLTVKREEQGICSNYVCDLKKGDSVTVCGPFGSSFLMPDDPQAKLLMICTGTGSAPFRGFTMRRQRALPGAKNSMKLFFGARTPQSLPYFGPLKKISEKFLEKHFAFSRVINAPKMHVQDALNLAGAGVADALRDNQTHIYICGLRAMEDGVDAALQNISSRAGIDWARLREKMKREGKYHVETY